MRIIDVIKTRFGLIVLSLISIALLLCCLCKYCSDNNQDNAPRTNRSYRDTISETEALNRRIKFINEYLDLRKTLKDYISKNNRSENRDDVIVVVSPGEVQLGTKIHN